MTLHKTIVRYQTLVEAVKKATAGAQGLESTGAGEVELMADAIRSGGGAGLETTAEDGSPAASGELGPPADVDEAAMLAMLTEALRAMQAEERGRSVLASPQNQLASLLQSHLLALGIDANRVGPTGSEDVLEVKFDERDIFGWVGSVFNWWRRIRPHPWQDAPQQPESLGNKTRVALLSDWGTGLYGAPVCAKSIERDPSGFGLLLHLGDVYYSGTEDEVRDRFLKFWPKLPNVRSRATNANHEMYSGGYGYFKVALPALGQNSSCFAVQNADWLLVGLDSAYQDHDLAAGQAEWLGRLLQTSGRRNVLLFTHHQPYSLLDSQGPRMVEKLAGPLKDGRIFGWYWGHEHRCVLYNQHPLWGLHGRCIGHGGYPHFRDKLGHLPLEHHQNGSTWRRHPTSNFVPGGLILDAPNRYVEGEEEEYGANGYVTLDFDGPQLVESVRDPEGRVLHEKKLA
jgi:hypothetical protein